MVPELRPRGIGEMLDAAVALYRARFTKLIPVSLAVVIPVQAFTTMVLLSAEPDRFQISPTGSVTPQYSSGSASAQLASIVVVGLVNLVSTAFITAVCTRIVADAYTDNVPIRSEALRVAGRRVLALAGLSIMVAMAQVAGALACIVGIVVPIALFSVAVPALVLEGHPVFRSLGRSVQLTREHLWRALGLVLSAQLLGVLIQLGLAVGINAWLNHSANTTTAIIVQGVASALAASVTTPFLATAIVALYFDLRIRNEALDIQLLMQRADHPQAAGAPL
ncbi:MAG TPA: hypothetical protein VFR41_00615 [Acidimicrobiia bacterium]|nr:hypothetical protein [Acidimicrobiia bacterium]